MTQNSDILNLETLETEYDNTMTLYEQAQTDYNSALNSATKKFKILRGKSFLGDILSKTTTLSLDNCIATCSKDKKCYGATFDTTASTDNCVTVGKNGSLTTSTDNKRAIVTELVVATANLQALNEKLLSMIDKMKQFRFTNTMNIPEEQVNKRTLINENNNNLNEQYNILLSDRQKLKELMEEYDKINQEKKNMELYTAQGSIYFTLWAYLCFISVFTVIILLVFPDSNINWMKFFIFTIIGFVLLSLVHYLRTAYAFMIFLSISIVLAVLIFKLSPI